MLVFPDDTTRRLLTIYPIPTVADEREFYTAQGWDLTGAVLPTPPDPNVLSPNRYTCANIDVHGDLEGDDLSATGNLGMWLRTGDDRYHQACELWAPFYRDLYPYPSDVSPQKWCSIDLFNNACHTFGWGLIDWFYVTGDPAFLDAARQVAAVVRPKDEVNAPVGMKWRGAGRGIARRLLLAIRLWEATGEQTYKDWADKIVALILGYGWRADWGMFYYDRSDGSPPDSSSPTSWHVSLLCQSLERYNRHWPSLTIRSRLLDVADFLLQYAQHPVWKHAPKFFRYGYPTGTILSYEYGDYVYWTDTTAPQVAPLHNAAWVEPLLISHRWTVDPAYRVKATALWHKAITSRHPSYANQTYPIEFANSGYYGASTILFKYGGLFQYVPTLFPTGPAPVPPPVPVAPRFISAKLVP